MHTSLLILDYISPATSLFSMKAFLSSSCHFLCPPLSSFIWCFSHWLKSSLAWVQTGEGTDSHSPCLSFVGPDYPPTTTQTHTHFHVVCVSSSPLCVHIHSHQQMVEGWGGQGFCTCPAKQCSLVIWPVRGEWQYANDWPPSATTTTGRRWGCGKAVSRSHIPTQTPPPPPLNPPPCFSSPHQALVSVFSEIMWSNPTPTPPTHTHLLHTGAFEPCVFSCCYLTLVDCLWLAFHTRGHRGLSNDALNN